MRVIALVAVFWLLTISLAKAQFVPPGGALPTGSECAGRVKVTPENRPVNTPYNFVVPRAGDLAPFYANPLNFVGPPASAFARVDGNYTGTTDEIIQWAACKWGMDQDMMRGQAWAESSWNELVKGDDEFEHALCTGGNGFDAWQSAGYCYTSYSIIQIKCTNYNACPMAYESTPFALDFRGSYWRGCMEGQIEYYKDSPTLPGYPKYPHGTPEEMAIGCMGSWYSGDWYTELAMPYIDRVKAFIRDKPWLPTVRFTAPAQGATVSGAVKVEIAHSANQCFYACVSSDVGFLSCEPGQGPWMWDTTIRVPNGAHTLTAQTFTCGLPSGNDMPTGWLDPIVTINVQNGASQQSVGVKPTNYKSTSWHHQQGSRSKKRR